MYPDISDKHNFRRPARPIPRLGADDAAVVAALIGGQVDPDADCVAQVDRILAAAYGADPAPPGALEAAVLEHGGRSVLMAVDFSYFLSGCGPRDIPEAIEDCGACEGTGRLGPPLMDDPVVSGASPTASNNVTDDPVPEPVTVEDEPPPMKGSPAGPAADRDGHADMAAEHAQLVAATAQARARYQDLQANRPDPGDIEACEVHKALEDAASQEVFDAAAAADFYLRENPELVPVYGTARAMLAEGICVIPVGAAKKADLKSWREFQERLPTPDELHEWFARKRDDRGLAVVCGQVSGGLEMLEFEARALKEGILQEFAGHLAEAGLTEVWQRVYEGYSEMSPSGGLHVLFRCDEIAGNTKLAARPATDEELAAGPEHKIFVLIETRGEGGYVVAAPSPGGCHPSGKPWKPLFGSPQTIDTISPAERDGLFACARKCSKMPPGRLHDLLAAATEPAGSKGEFVAPERHRPRDVYQREADWGADILEPAGWALDHELSSGEKRWRRPGKAPGEGHSAVTGNPDYPGDSLFVFTSSTEFEPQVPYDKFTAYAVLYHGGDLAAAEKAVQEQGYSDRRQILPSEFTPLPTAREIARTHYTDASGTLLVRWHRGAFYARKESFWQQKDDKDDKEVKHWLYEITGNARVENGIDEETGQKRYRPWNPNKLNITDLTEALALGVVHLDPDIEPESWITGVAEGHWIPVANGLLERDTRAWREHSPDYFNTWALPYDYDPDAPEPLNWLAFLRQLWPEDPESVTFLQEWSGYLISGDTSQQKIMLLIGPPRSGKGTIARVLTALMGARNVTSPTFNSLAGQFGLAPLIGKPLAIIPDARFGGRDPDVVVERLLSISGEDSLSVERKYRGAWEGRMPTRLMALSNELPSLRDASAALATRFIPLSVSTSWLGREDTGLTKRLIRELPGILRWALDGMDRLREQGRFTMPAAAAEALADLERLASPVKSWAQDCCEFGPAYQESPAALHEAFLSWANEQGMKHVPPRERFGRDLRAAFPALTSERPRGADKKQHLMYVGIRLSPSVARVLSLMRA